jgi:hypothetical protein
VNQKLIKKVCITLSLSEYQRLKNLSVNIPPTTLSKKVLLDWIMFQENIENQDFENSNSLDESKLIYKKLAKGLYSDKNRSKEECKQLENTDKEKPP